MDELEPEAAASDESTTDALPCFEPDSIDVRILLDGCGVIPPMEFHQLRYFVAAADEMSMSRAAERVHVSNPALSRQIALLEEETGVLLFDRIRKRIHLTEAGGFFLAKARQLLCDADSGV